MSKTSRTAVSEKTDLSAAETSVADLKALLDGAVNTAIYALDLNGIIKGWNTGAEKIFGYKADEIIGTDFRQFYPKELLDKGYVEREIQETIKKGTITGEGWRIAKGGRLFYGRVVLTAQKNSDGEVIALVKTVTDETERKLLEDNTNALLNGAVNTAIYGIDLKGIIKGWNSGAEKIFGYKADEVIGTDFRQFYPKELLDKGFVDWEIKETIEKGTITGEGWRIAKGGRLFYGSVVLTAQRNDAGEVIALVKTVTDQTERKKLEDNTNALLNGAVNTAIYGVDLKGVIKGWNSGAEKIFGYRADEVIGTNFRQFYPKELLDKGYVDWEIQETISKGTITGEGWRIAKGGRLFYGSVVLTAQKNEAGEVIGLIKTVTDETERQRLKEKAEEQRKELLNVVSVLTTSTSQLASTSVELTAATEQSVAALSQTTATSQEVMQTADQMSEKAKGVSSEAKNVVE
ncbi:MAG: PAS domain S-box protein, partial [Candidatus Obscuribacterales bacterium]|nr:PAS domain S-box protein [Candidatus Obscuribacterales bacterium]